MATLIAPNVETLELDREPGSRRFVNRATGQPNSSDLLARRLDAIGPPVSPDREFTLGYTLLVRLLRLFVRTGRGWEIDHDRLDAVLKPIRDVDRPVLLHLASNHFSVDDNRDLVAELTADPRNLMQTQDGPAATRNYFYIPIVPWTIADTEAPVNRLRAEATRAVAAAVAGMDPAHRSRIRAVSIIGEVHHYCGDLTQGPSYDDPMLLTDYAPCSLEQFRRFLSDRFGSIATLNAELETSFASFEAVVPPKKNVLCDWGGSVTEHIDHSAAGKLAVHGLLRNTATPRPPVLVYVDDRLECQAVANLSRTDVLDTRPEFHPANIGFHLLIDHSRLPPGWHRLSVRTQHGGASILLAERDFLVCPHGGWTAPANNRGPVCSPDYHPDVESFLDGPHPRTSVLHNPLATLFLAFREQQVRRYVEWFAGLAQFPRGRPYTNQITRASGGWNLDVFAVDQSLLPNPYYRLGVSLYGGSAFGEAFFDYLRSLRIREYGVGELHPLIWLSVEDNVAMLRRHRAAGAAYLAPYYVPLLRTEHDSHFGKLTISEDAPTEASRNLYQALCAVMRN